MPTISADQRLYVQARLPEALFLILQSHRKTKHLILTKELPPPGSDFKGTIDPVGLGALIADSDLKGRNPRFWERSARRWISREAAIEPEQLRRVCHAVEAHWVVALGFVGYPLHALAMMHGLWKIGCYTEAAFCARAIFWRTSPSSLSESLQSKKARVIAARLRAPYDSSVQKRLDRALLASWRRISLPAAPIAPLDLPGSADLYGAYMLLDSAIRGRGHNLAIRLAPVQDQAAHLVLMWAGKIKRKPTRLVRCSKNRT